MSGNNVLEQSFINEWNKVTGALKLNYGPILDKIGFCPVDSEWGHRTNPELATEASKKDVQLERKFMSSMNKFKEEWDKVCKKLKGSRYEKCGITITPMAGGNNDDKI